MSSLIDRQAAIEVASKECFELRGVFGRIEDGLNELPTVKAIPIAWLKEHLPNDEDYIRFKGYRDLPENDLMNIAYDKGFNNGWEAFRKAFIEDTIADWEKEYEQL